MKIKDGLVLQYQCITTSLFHTTHREYTSLLKCAPYILGTTIRGALLRQMIRLQNCPYIEKLQKPQEKQKYARIHQTCKEDCPVKPFFDAPLKAWFTFGEFNEQVEYLYKSITRIGLERKVRSASEGAIVTIETINKGAKFTFAIILFGDCKTHADLVNYCVRKWMTQDGIGRGRSYGMGKFKVRKILKPITLDEFLESAESQIDQHTVNDSISLRIKTPLIVGDGKNLQVTMDRHQVADWFAREVRQALDRILINSKPDWKCNAIDLQVNPDFISRFSHEMGLRENRYVFMDGSILQIHRGNSDEDWFSQLNLALKVGIGEWSEMGFGRLAPIKTDK